MFLLPSVQVFSLTSLLHDRCKIKYSDVTCRENNYKIVHVTSLPVLEFY